MAAPTFGHRETCWKRLRAQELAVFSIRGGPHLFLFAFGSAASITLITTTCRRRNSRPPVGWVFALPSIVVFCATHQAVPSGDESGEAAPSPDVDEMLKTLPLGPDADVRCDVHTGRGEARLRDGERHFHLGDERTGHGREVRNVEHERWRCGMGGYVSFFFCQTPLCGMMQCWAIPPLSNFEKRQRPSVVISEMFSQQGGLAVVRT